MSRVASAVVAKLIDGFGRKLEAFNLYVGPKVESNIHVFEEVAELGIPLFFANAILALKHVRRQARP